MKLRYIYIHGRDRMETIKGAKYVSHFNYHVYFICYCLTKKVRQLKFETDDTFEMLVINIESEDTQVEIIKVPYPILAVHLPFDSERYEKGDKIQRCEYYMELLRSGLKKAAEVKQIPYNEIMAFAYELADNGYVYEWDFRSIIIKEYGLRVKFVCRLDTDAFTMNAIVFVKRNPEPIYCGQVVRAMPHYIHFDCLSKKINIENNKIVLHDKISNNDLLYIDIESLLDRHIKVEFATSPYPDDPAYSEYHYSLQSSLTYDNYEFK